MRRDYETDVVYDFIQDQRKKGRHTNRMSWDEACRLYEWHQFKMLASAIGGIVVIFILGYVLLNIT